MGNPAESGGDPEQSSENAQGNTPAIDNQIAGHCQWPSFAAAVQ